MPKPRLVVRRTINPVTLADEVIVEMENSPRPYQFGFHFTDDQATNYHRLRYAVRIVEADFAKHEGNRDA